MQYTQKTNEKLKRKSMNEVEDRKRYRPQSTGLFHYISNTTRIFQLA